jgi:hypothetical protein
MHIILLKIRTNLLFFYPTDEELHDFANEFAAHGAPDTIKFWAIIDIQSIKLPNQQ